MMVEYFTYKVEFQDRGAGHAHGTLWLSLDNIENLLNNEDGTLSQKTIDDDKKTKGPFDGLKEAFSKFKNNEILNEEEKNP